MISDFLTLTWLSSITHSLGKLAMEPHQSWLIWKFIWKFFKIGENQQEKYLDFTMKCQMAVGTDKHKCTHVNVFCYKSTPFYQKIMILSVLSANSTLGCYLT